MQNVPEVSLNYISSNNINNRIPRNEYDINMNNTLNRDYLNNNINAIDNKKRFDKKGPKNRRNDVYDNQNYNNKYHKKKKEINNLK